MLAARCLPAALLLCLCGVRATGTVAYEQGQDLYAEAIDIMDRSILVDGHVDLPFIVKSLGTYSVSILKPLLTVPLQDHGHSMSSASTMRLCLATWT